MTSGLEWRFRLAVGRHLTGQCPEPRFRLQLIVLSVDCQNLNILGMFCKAYANLFFTCVSSCAVSPCRHAAVCVELRESISRSWHGACPAALVSFALVLISRWYMLRWASGRRKYTTPLKSLWCVQCSRKPQNCVFKQKFVMDVSLLLCISGLKRSPM